MSKKLLSEAQVRKFMGLANLDANVSSNFIQEKYHAKKDDEEVEEGLNLGDKHKKTAGKAPEGEDPHKKAREMDEGMHDKKEEDMHAEGMHDKKEEDMHEAAHEEADMEMDAELDGGDAEEPDESEVDVMLDQDEVADAKEAANKLVSLLDKLMGGAAPEMDDAPAEEPPMDMGMDDEEDLGLDETTTTTELTEDEIVQEVAKRVAKRINEAAKKADK